ncbi:MAG: ATP-binding protein [Bdellovibrionota bacterium]
MIDAEERFRLEYFSILSSFLSGAGESALEQGYEIGRKAIEADLGPVQMAEIHRTALSKIIADRAPPSAASVVAAGELLTTSLAPFEMTHQGYRESISKLKRLNESLDQTNHELEAFSYSVSHDLRAPLRGITGFTKILLEDYSSALTEDALGLMKKVVGAAHRMELLIEALLSLSKVGRRTITRESVDLTKLITELVSELQQTAPERSLELQIVDGVVAQGDLQLLRAAIGNLLSNAWKFTAKRTDARIEFGVMSSEGKTVYYIKDNGAGFDMKYADRLFGAFQRLHTTEQFEGTGIGLATARRVITRHGGRIWAESELNRGTTFYFTLS